MRNVLLAAVFLVVSLFSCSEKREADRNTDTDAKVAVLATVNEAPITEYDMKLRLGRFAHDETVNSAADQNVLETLVRNELIYQQALELGLDKNTEYRKKIYETEAQLRAFQRQEMSALFREYTRNNAAVTDSEAQEYFEKNSTRIRTRFHVFQIYYKGDGSQIAEARDDLKRGVSFERVAAKRFPPLPKDMKAPWDLGYLYWSQIPPSWQGIVDRMEPGQVSDIIEGPNARFWIVKMVDKTVDPKITFATERERILEVLRAQKADELYDGMLSRMRAKSRIVQVRE